MPETHENRHAAVSPFLALNAREAEGVRLVSRRGTLKAGLAGMAGLTLPRLLEARDAASRAGSPLQGRKAVILLWMTGGPSQIDTWDVKPMAPREIRGPFTPIDTKLPGVQICEYLPKLAGMLDKFTLIRSVDCRRSNHEPNTVFQTGNLEAEPRKNAEASRYPAIGAIVSRFRAMERRALPGYMVLNMKSRSHVAWGGDAGQQHDPFVVQNTSRLFSLPRDLSSDRLRGRVDLSVQFDKLRRDLDLRGSMAGLEKFSQQAFDLVSSPQSREAFDLSRESAAVRSKYGTHTWAEHALLARRLVEAGVSFVTIDVSHYGNSGSWDNHGDNIPPYGGIWNGLRPLLPPFDHMLSTLVADLEERGLLDDVLVLALGDFGRTPQTGTQGSTDGRNHWLDVMSMLMAGGGLRHGQVIGASDRHGGHIQERPVTPQDLAATLYRHFGVPLDTQYIDHRGRPKFVIEGGEPLRELF